MRLTITFTVLAMSPMFPLPMPDYMKNHHAGSRKSHHGTDYPTTP